MDIQQKLRGQIYWRKWDEDDRDQRGIIGKSRPVIIVSNDVGLRNSYIASIVPLTTADKSKLLPTQVPLFMNGQHQTVLCEQITTVNIERLENYVATVTHQKMKEIDKALSIALGLLPVPTSSNRVVMAKEATVENKMNDDHKKRRWTDDMKRQLLKEYASIVSASSLEKEEFAIRWKFKSYSAMASTINRFTKQCLKGDK